MSEKIRYERFISQDLEGFVFDGQTIDPNEARRREHERRANVTRTDYSEDQPRDDHGRFGSGALGLEKNAKGEHVADAQANVEAGGSNPSGKGVRKATREAEAAREAEEVKHAPPPSPTTAKELGKLGDELNAMHEKPTFGQAPDALGNFKHDDYGVSSYDHEPYATPERQTVLEHLRNIVEVNTGITQKYPVAELRINEMSGANGMLSPAHDEKFGGYGEEKRFEHMPTRITITPDIHMNAMVALQRLESNKAPDHAQIGGLHTYIHEMCHTTSPMAMGEVKNAQGNAIPSGYSGHGAIIEEVTTEVMARGIMASILRETPDRPGISSAHSQITASRAGDRSSYQPAINWTMRNIREAVSACAPHSAQLSEKSVSAVPILRDAVQAYRGSRPVSPYTKNQAAKEFAMHIGHAAVAAHPNSDLHAGEVAERMRIALLQVENGPDSDILQRFDAETMTRFDAQSSVWTVPRNDIEAAMAITNPSPDEMTVLLQLQDNPELLLQAIAKRSP